MSNQSVLDASALLALLYREPGADVVRHAITSGAAMSAVNFAEVVGKLDEDGLSALAIRQTLGTLKVNLFEFDSAAAYRTGLLRSQTKKAGLSLGDRAGIALAQALDVPILTTDRQWAKLQLGVTVQLIR